MIDIHGHKDSHHPSSSTRAGLSIDNLSFRVYMVSVFVVVGFAALVVVVVVVVAERRRVLVAMVWGLGWSLGWLRGLLLWQKQPKIDDAVTISQNLVSSLNLPDSTTQFVTALRHPDELSAVVYIVATSPLSANSLSDIRHVVRAVEPRAVVSLIELQDLRCLQEEERFGAGKAEEEEKEAAVPTSVFGVIRECFLKEVEDGSFESRARIEALRSIFGTGFFGHALEAKQAAKDSRAAFYYLNFPCRTRDALGGHQQQRGVDEEGTASEEDSSQTLSGMERRQLAGFRALISYEEKSKWRDLLNYSFKSTSIFSSERLVLFTSLFLLHYGSLVRISKRKISLRPSSFIIEFGR